MSQQYVQKPPSRTAPEHPVSSDPRYSEVKALAAQGKFDEAQAIENQIIKDVLFTK